MVNYTVQLNQKRYLQNFEKFKVEIKPSQIVLKNDLNKIGIFKVDINFHTEVAAQISIKIDKIQSSILFHRRLKKCVTFNFNCNQL